MYVRSFPSESLRLRTVLAGLAWGLVATTVLTSLRAQALPREGDVGEPVIHALSTGGLPVSGSLSASGLAYYYEEWTSAEGSSILRSTREDRFDEFGPGVPLGGVLERGRTETFPVIASDGRTLYFSGGQDGWPGAGKSDLWYARTAEPGNPHANFDEVFRITDPEVNTAAGEKMGGVSRDGELLVFVRDWQEMWIARFRTPHAPGDGFTDERALSELNLPGHASVSPSFSPCGGFLLWSDWPEDFGGGTPPRPGGLGGTDVWMAPIDPGAAGAPVPVFQPPTNLGPPISSEWFEIVTSPLIAHDGRSVFVGSNRETRSHIGEGFEFPVAGYPDALLCSYLDDSHACPETCEITPPTPEFRRGDSNDDGGVDLSDAVFTLNWLFLGGPAPTCKDAPDSDDNGNLEISDAVYLLNYLFLGGPPPKIPFPECGSDPTGDELTCESFDACGPS